MTGCALSQIFSRRWFAIKIDVLYLVPAKSTRAFPSPLFKFDMEISASPGQKGVIVVIVRIWHQTCTGGCLSRHRDIISCPTQLSKEKLRGIAPKDERRGWVVRRCHSKLYSR